MTEYGDIWNDDRWLDRLVDGELPRDEYDRLLRSFEQHPEGWRRCAQAFLEAQAWQKELSVIRNAPAACPRIEVPRPADRDFNWTPVLAVAASFLIAFALGLGFRVDWLRDGAAGNQDLAVEHQPTGERPADSPESSLAGAEPQPVSVPDDNITLVLDGSEEPLQVPVIDWSPEHERLLSQPSTPVPPELQRMLQRAGRELRTQRQFVPVRTQDGRQILVPVEQLEITPVVGPHYQ